jgi:hypothetical protein
MSTTSIICDCGGRYTQNHRATHMRTQRHTRFANNAAQPHPLPADPPAFTQVVREAIDKASKIKKIKEASFEPTNDMCAICMDPMTTKETAITSCNHRYCTACFASHAVYGLTHSNRHIKNPITCPMCRAAVVAVACQVLEYDPYTKRLIQERDLLQQKLTQMEATHARCARTLEVGDTLRDIWDVPEAIYAARYAYILNMEQSLFRYIPRIKHRLNQVESQLRVADDAAIIIQTQTTRIFWLDGKTDRERIDIRACMEELKVVI